MITIRNAQGFYDLVSKPLLAEENEHLILVTLNSTHAVTGVHWLCSGCDTSVTFSVKQIVRQAVISNACAVGIIHNHPSGNPNPSAADIKNTEKLHEALKLFEISFLDHIIISKGLFFSFSEDTVTEIENIRKNKCTDSITSTSSAAREA